MDKIIERTVVDFPGETMYFIQEWKEDTSFEDCMQEPEIYLEQSFHIGGDDSFMKIEFVNEITPGFLRAMADVLELSNRKCDIYKELQMESSRLWNTIFDIEAILKENYK